MLHPTEVTGPRAGASPTSAIDLNLLKVFLALTTERNLTRAGRCIGLTQPAMSHALRRLREIFQDELFVRTPDGMEPTTLSLSLAPGIRNALVDINDAFGAEHAFDPMTSDATLSIGINSDLISMLVLSELTKRLIHEAPNIDVRIVHILDSNESLRANNAFAGLDAGRVDLLVMREWKLPDRFAREKFFQSDFVCVASSANRKFRPPMGLDMFNSFEHVMVTLGDVDAGFLTNELAAKGVRRNVKTRVPLYADAVRLAAETSLVVLLPRVLLPSALKSSRLKVDELPLESPVLKFEFVWHARRDSDPSIIWLRKKIRDCYEHVTANLEVSKLQ